MQINVTDFTNDAIVYTISGCTQNELENKLNLFFTSQDLIVKTDKPDEKMYIRGNKVLRFLFGVFVKYFKITVTIKKENELYSVRLLRDMNFYMSGGLIGRKSARKEFSRITDAFKIYFAN
jgi:hypothetical protein